MFANKIDPTYLAKVVIVGPESFGKTSLTSRFNRNEFNYFEKKTEVMNFILKVYEAKNGSSVKFQLWDIGYQGYFVKTFPKCYQEANAVILTIDLTSRINVEQQATRFLEDIKTHAPNALLFLVGCKADQTNTNIGINQEEVKTFLTKNKFDMYFETSARTGAGVKELFQEVANQIILKKIIMQRNITMKH